MGGHGHYDRFQTRSRFRVPFLMPVQYAFLCHAHPPHHLVERIYAHWRHAAAGVGTTSQPRTLPAGRRPVPTTTRPDVPDFAPYAEHPVSA